MSDYISGRMNECCEKCKFLYPLKKFVNGDWEYSYVCLAFPFTEEKDEICYAMVIEHPEVQMCEMFDDTEDEDIDEEWYDWRDNR